jgi:hypothetical protein
MSDFDTDQLSDDWGGVCGSSQSGEAFTQASVTYYGVFNQVDARFTFDLVGSKTDVSLVLVVAREAFTPVIDALIFRAADSVTYRINDVRNDQAVYECDLVKPR